MPGAGIPNLLDPGRGTLVMRSLIEQDVEPWDRIADVPLAERCRAWPLRAGEHLAAFLDALGMVPQRKMPASWPETQEQ